MVAGVDWWEGGAEILTSQPSAHLVTDIIKKVGTS